MHHEEARQMCRGEGQVGRGGLVDDLEAHRDMSGGE